MKLKREEKLLLDCLKARNGGEFERLTASDWGLVAQQSVKYEVSPCVYEKLKGFSLPDEVIEDLRQSYLSTAASNVRHYHELTKVLGILKEEGLPVIVLKGAHLAEMVYGNIGVRSMCIEHNIVPPLPIDVEELWERAEAARIADVELLVLSPEDLLLHLCVHLSFHHLFGYAGVRALCDIRETIGHYKTRIDWNVIRDRAREWQVSNAVELSLFLAKDLLDADVPDTVLPTVRTDHFDLQKQWALHQIFNGGTGGDLFSPFFCFLWRPVSMPQKVAHLLKFMFPPSEHVSERFQTTHGSSKNYLSYITRVTEHFGHYARATWKILTRDPETIQQVTRQNQNTAMREWLSSN